MYFCRSIIHKRILKGTVEKLGDRLYVIDPDAKRDDGGYVMLTKDGDLIAKQDSKKKLRIKNPGV